ncbi:MAG: hypothetical protein WC314_03415 [Vulcanimicrobiota bacterium]
MVLGALAVLLGASCRGTIVPERAYGPPVPADAPKQTVEIHQPKTLGSVDTFLKDHVDTPLGVSCRTCHGTAQKGALISQDAPADFHKNLQVMHGAQSCNACHDEDRSRLHLADGTLLDFDQVMTLCAQCHGPQYRDYQNGSHGGMEGYWDLRRGERKRNNCVDCHTAHQPAYPQVMPVHPPKDRFLTWPREEDPHHE